MYRSIIVPLDGSARSQAALPLAASFAHASGATLDLVRVHLHERPDLDRDPAWDDIFRDGEQRHLESLALAYESVAGTAVGASLLDEPVVESLARFAESRPSPLFIMAGHGRTGLRRAVLGSTADGLVRQGQAPVLVLRDRGGDHPASWKVSRKPFAQIVLPLDGSTHAEAGIAHAVAVASATGARIRLLRVVGPAIASAVIDTMTMHPLSSYDEMTKLRNEMAETYLQHVVDRIQAGGKAISVSTEVALGSDASTAIIETCHQVGADLVVIPTHGRGASRLLVSAVGDRLLREGPDAVLFVRPAANRLPATTSASRTRAARPVALRIRA